MRLEPAQLRLGARETHATRRTAARDDGKYLKTRTHNSWYAPVGNVAGYAADSG